MKSLRLMLFIMLAGFSHLQAQTSITLSFTGQLNGSHLPLDSICIRNLSQGGDTTIIGNDTTILLDASIGIEETTLQTGENLCLLPVFPNPFNGTTTARFQLAQQEQVTLSLFDLRGSELKSYTGIFSAGEHRFTLHTGNERVSLLSVATASHRHAQKLIHIGSCNGASRMEYAGWNDGSALMKKGTASFPWMPGDNLLFTGYSQYGTDTITDNPNLSTTYTFQFLPLIPLPVANFIASDTVIYLNDTVHFTDLSLHSPISWTWYFGDGNSSQQQNPSHIYTTPGIFTVRLIAGNTSGYDTLTRNNYITVSVICPPTVTDINGNVYNTVLIGYQCWMKENLKTRNYNTGLPVSIITDNVAWASSSSGARCWYNNDSATYAATYGALYNWFAAGTGNLCPTGWHVPADAEWTVLTDFVGGLSVAGIHLKEAGTAHWNSPNSGATNSTGFTALPGGARGAGTGTFADIGNSGYWWSSTPSSATQSWIRNLSHNMMTAGRGYLLNTFGLSVRCVRD
jgi:uncharacterized protein (TIGR02145 family)